MTLSFANGITSFFPTRVDDRSHNVFSLNTTKDPDEDVFPVKNLYYTNVITCIALNFAVEAAATPKAESLSADTAGSALRHF